MSGKKVSLHYCHIRASEGLNPESKASELCLERFDKEVYKKCGHCCQLCKIKRNFKKDSDTCDMCFKLL